jgi:hypothetical protein
VAWLSLAARKGAFGEAELVYCEREMRAADQKAAVGASKIDPGWSPAVRAKAAESSFGIAATLRTRGHAFIIRIRLASFRKVGSRLSSSSRLLAAGRLR